MANFTVRPIDPDDPVEGHLYFPFHDQPGKPRGNDPIAYLRNTDDHAFLRTVGENRRVDVTNQTQMLRIAKLFDTQLVMIYRNGNEWFDVSVPVQRLLARVTVQTTGPGGSAA